MTGEAAVHAVGLQITTSLRWAFRSQPVLDYGIDAQVEIKHESVPTGRLLALQIKGGPSRFTEPTDDGWVYRPSARHVEYWLGHVLPVVVVLVDVENDVCYWQEVSTYTVVSTGKGYKVEVPRSNTVPTAAEKWELLAGDLVAQATDRYEANIQHLPPQAVEPLVRVHSASAVAASLLALYLAEGRAQPELTAQSLVASPPSWLVELGSVGWRVVGGYATEHGQNAEAAEAFQRAADSATGNNGRLLAAAGLNLRRHDKARARELLQRAQSTPEAHLIARLGLILLDEDVESVQPFVIPPDLDLSTDDANTEALAQAVLGLNASRIRDHDEAIRRFRAALDLSPQNSDYMVALSEEYGRRAGSQHVRTGDLREAAGLAREAFEQRARWSGPVLEPLSVLLRTLMLQGDFEKVIDLAAAHPHGRADLAVARSPVIARYALEAAKLLSRGDVVDGVLGNLRDVDGADHLQRIFGGSEMTAEQRAELWQEELRRARADGDFQSAAGAVLHLARLGVDGTSTLEEAAERGVLPDAMLQCARAVATAVGDLDEGLPRLRSLADTDIVAAEQLIVLLAEADRIGDAESACARAYARFREPDLLALRAEVLSRRGAEAAESAAREAVAEPAVIGMQRARMLTLLAQAAAQRREWDNAERHLQAALASASVLAEENVWNLVGVQLQQRRDHEAAATLARYQPNVRDTYDAWSWLRTMVTQTWSDSIVSEALTLASRFSDDAQLAAALLTHVITATRGEDTDTQVAEVGETHAVGQNDVTRPSDPRPMVSSDLRRAAFKALDDLVDRHGSATSIQRIRGTTEEQISHMQAMLSAEDREPLRRLLEQVRRGEMPLGLASSAVGKPYGLAVVQRAAGPLAAVAAADDVHEKESEAGNAAMGGSVVVEASSLMLAASIGQLDALKGHFDRVFLPSQSRDDITATTVEVRGIAASSGMLDWDEQHQRLVLHEWSPRERALLYERAEALDAAARGVEVADVPALGMFADLDDERSRAWLAPIELTSGRGLALWSDDVALRALARSVGVSAFGTAALVEALVTQEINRASGPDAGGVIDNALEKQADLSRQLMREFVVDVPVTLDQLLAQAAEDEWAPAAAAVPLTRATWWAWADEPLADLLAIYGAVSEHCPEALPSWQVAAMQGAASAWREPPEAAALSMAAVALLGFTQNATPADARDGLIRAAQLAKSLDLLDPHDHVPAAARVLQRSGHLKDAQEFVVEVLRDSETDRSSTS